MTYRSHRQKALKKVFQKIGWIKHTFSTRTVPFLKILWNSVVQPHLDYGSILTAPMNKGEIRAAEKPLKNFTKMALEGKNLHYWKRLELFRLFSNQRRMERYKIFYIWKSLNGHVPSIGLKWQNRDCSKLTYPKTFGSKGRARTLQEMH